MAMLRLRVQRAVFVGLVLLVSISLISLSDKGSSVLWGGSSWRTTSGAPLQSQAAFFTSPGERIDPSLPLPPEYQIGVPESSDPNPAAEIRSGFCRDRFSTKFLDDFRDRRAQYCSDQSTSGLTCFHTVNSGSFTAGSIDSFCIARHGILFDAKRQKFALDCRVRDLSDHEITAGAIPLGKIQSYQYLTGPKFLLNEWTDLTGASERARDEVHAKDRNFVVLLKREVDGNLWHCLNELMSIMTTLDVLRMTPDPSSPGGKALFLAEDIANTEVVLLDEHPDGAFFDLFRMFSGKPPVRLAEWVARNGRRAEEAGAGAGDPSAAMIPVENLILPYAGAASPLWTDWVRVPAECGHNAMLQAFVRRVLDFYGLPRARRPRPGGTGPGPGEAAPPRLNVTVVLRRGSRQLMGLDAHLLGALRDRFSRAADVRLVDFAGVPFREQVAAARDTDVLVGMHGAGLTHAMFMEEGRGALVEVQPDRLCHHGFRNLARMTGQAYFVAGANKVVGHCYPPAGAGARGEELEMMPDDGTALPSSWETSRCWSYTASPDDWSFACSDPEVTGGEQSYMVCRNREESDEWYSTCSKKEASDMYWLTRYVMEQDRFLDLVGRAIEAVREKQAAERVGSRT